MAQKREYDAVADSPSLPSHAGAIVIGGGAVGCSTLYHLAKFGISDCILLERDQLTSGTTWHSAAQVRQLRSTRSLTRLVKYSARLYSELEAETGQITGWNQVGSISLATTPDRLIDIRRQAALSRAYDIPAEEVGADEVKRLWPLANCDDVISAVYSPDDGRVNPSDFCQALVKGARARGAKLFEKTPVTGFLKTGDRIAGVQTAQGDIKSDIVIISGGLWSRALAAKAGVVAPLLPCEHFYLLTKPVDGGIGHLPTLADTDSHLYIRDEVGGLLVGCFEPMGKPIDPAVLGDDFSFGLLDEDWDHFEPMMENALHRLPVLETAEVRMLLNGPESFTPDGHFMLGESDEVDGLYLACGMNSIGVACAGGAGWALAQWIVEGCAPFSLEQLDPRRFSAVLNDLDCLMARAPEVLGKHYKIHYPGMQYDSARNLRTLPLHDRWVAEKARFGQVFGWERPQYFGSDGEPELTYGRPAWHDQLAREVEAAHSGGAVFDESPFGKIRVSGAGAAAFLDRVCANDMTRPPGRVIYTAMLNERGTFEADYTALRLSEDDYRIYTGTGAIKRDMAWLRRHVGEGEQVTLSDETEDYAILALMGARSGEVVQAIGGDALGDIGYFHHAAVELAGVEVQAACLSYVGEAGWEMTCAAADAVRLYDALAGAGAVPAGLYAQNAMRVEKRYLAMGHDLDGDVTPIEAGLEFAVKKRGGFIGAEALSKQRKDGVPTQMVSIVLKREVWPLGNEPIYAGDRLAGEATSAAFGYRVGAPVVLAYLDRDVLADPEGARVEVIIAGERVAGTASLKPAFDPGGERMRGVSAKTGS